MVSQRPSVTQITHFPHSESYTPEDSHHILIVEDEMLLARELESHLITIGYRFTSIASSAEDAITILQHQPVNVVLMDIMLKGNMDGIAAASHIRSHYHVPVVYLTAYSDVKMLSQAVVSCPSGYLMKPCTETDLQLTLKIALAQYQIEGQLRQSLMDAERLTNIDPLTGVLTNPGLVSTIDQELQRAHRYHRPLSALLLRIDNFPILVERYGSAMGDRILLAAARTTRHYLRQTDHLGRIDGETFGIILPETSSASASSVANRIRKTLTEQGLGFESLKAEADTMGITVSIGLATRLPSDADYRHLMTRAQTALRDAANRGGNSVVANLP